MRSTRVRRILAPLVVALALALGLAPASSAARPPKAAPPSKVVVIVVDALSREIVQKYGMTNIQALMRDGVNSPNALLGHLGSVTVVTHNVITTGALPKNMGWTDEGYRDTGALIGPAGAMWVTSDFTSTQMFALQKSAGYPKLADYLHAKRPGSKVVAISPKTYAGYGLGGPGADSIVTFSGRNYDCDGNGKNWRGPDGVNVPAYLSQPACGRFYVNSAKTLKYDTNTPPAWMYPLDGNRYTTGKDPDHEGSDVWAADAAIKVMDNESDWSGIFVTLPGVDKAAHMWGSIDDPGAQGPNGEPMTHMPAATKIADEQVGKIVGHLRDTGQLDDTLVVLTADHGSVPARSFYGVDKADQGYYNWYYGAFQNGSYLDPQPALQPLLDTGNIEATYSDSMVRAWLKGTSPDKVREAVRVMDNLPGVSAVWVRQGSRFQRMTFHPQQMKGPELAWFVLTSQLLLDSTAAPSGADVIATLVDDTTYSVAGDHGGIQRRAQQIPIIFAGGGLRALNQPAPIRSVDIMPTVLQAMQITPTHKLDGVAYPLPRR